jgi:ferric-dicitrate binding protein FerR (iron transport regulator)
MEIRVLDFAIGLGAGIALGLGLVWLASRVRTWLGRSEKGRLSAENRELKRRLAEKDRRVSRMMQEAERLAEKLAQGKALPQGKVEEEAKQNIALSGSSTT